MGPWLTGLVVVLGAGGLAAGVAMVLHGRVSDGIRDQFRENSGQIAGVVGSLFAITAGFTIVTAWGAVGSAGATIAHEASAVVDVYWYAHTLQDPERDQLQGLLREYTRDVVEVEWPLMQDHRVLSEEAWTAMDQSRARLQSLQPTAGADVARYSQAIQRMEDIADDRRTRRSQAKSEVPEILWIALGVAGLIVVAVPVVFGAPNRFLHGLLAFGAAAVVAIILVLISEINHPFSGEVTTGPGAMEEALVGFDRIDATPSYAPAP
jgi:hypothetical protein